MRFTRRLSDWHIAGTLGFASLSLSVAMVTATASCSSDEDGQPATSPSDDAATEAASKDGDVAADASREAGPIDAAALPVVCASEPCALSLATTFGVDEFDPSEGFCARLEDGSVACWGANGAGQLGRGEDGGVDDDPIPAKVPGISDVVALDHTCAVDRAGSIRCWGTGPFGADGATTTERAPVKIPVTAATGVGVGPTTACATTAEGVVCWGRNDYGQVAPFGSAPRFEALPPHKVALPPGPAVHSLAVDRASFAVREDGVLVSWGANPPLARASSLSPDPYPLPVLLAGITSIDLSRDNACATAGGTGYCWGAVAPKDLDQETIPVMVRAFPTPVVTPEPVTRIATTRFRVILDRGSRIVQPERWCATGISGAVYCWGYNTSGQAGDGTKRHAYEAVKVLGLPGPAADVKTMPDTTCALLTSGKIYCWGSNYYGQLGSGEYKVPSLVPKEVRLP